MLHLHGSLWKTLRLTRIDKLVRFGSMALWLSHCAAPIKSPEPLRSADPPKVCDSCEDWNKPHAPFRIFGNTYYVGVQGLSAVLIDGGDGLVLIDGGLSQSAPLIAQNIESLGFRIKQVRWIVSSHPHYDHVGGIAALQRWSGAKVAASPRGVEALRSGTVPPDDPQAAFGVSAMGFPAVSSVETIAEGAAVEAGNVSVTVHYTPGHTPSGTSWSWRSCESSRCVHVVYVDSLNPVSAPGFRFTQSPERMAEFRSSIAKVRSLPCDIVISAHPGFSSLFERWEASQRSRSRESFVTPSGCTEYAADAEQRLTNRLAEEQQANQP